MLDFCASSLMQGTLAKPTLDQARRLLATAIVQFIEQRLANAGVRDIYLLTESAAAVFAGWGYRTIGRNAAPPPIAASRQFTTLCSERAQLMHKTLATHGIPPRREGLG